MTAAMPAALPLPVLTEHARGLIEPGLTFRRVLFMSATAGCAYNVSD